MPLHTAIPSTLFRVDDQAFRPSSMVDTLYDYAAFLGARDGSAPAPIGTGPASPRTVAVIGAGAAGLAAAYELSRVQNLSVHLFEAGDRLGGRMDSIVVDDPPFAPKIFEMGCMRFPPTSATLFHYLGLFGLQPAGMFPDPGKVMTTLYYQNRVIPWPAGQPAPSDPDFQRIGNDFASMLRHILGDPSAPNRTDPTTLIDNWAVYEDDPTPANQQNVVAAWQRILDEYKDTTYYRAVYQLGQDTNVVERPWTEEDMDRFGALGVGSGGFGPLFEVNFVEILRLFANGWETNQQLLAQGIRAVVDGFQQAIAANGVRVATNQPATGIVRDGDQLLVQFGAITSAPYDAVIVSTTTRAMQVMGLTAGAVIGEPSKVAVRELHLMSSSKLFVSTTSKFWYAENNPTGRPLPANIQTDEALRGLYCLDYDPPVDGKPNTSGKGVVLVSYVWGDDSTKLLALDESQRMDLFLESLQAIDPQFTDLLRAQTEEVRIVDWQGEANYYGAFKLDYPGQEQACHDGYFQYQDGSGVLLAGDSVSWAGGWVEGALTSGINAAVAALQHVGGAPRAQSPLTIPTDLYTYDNPPRSPDPARVEETADTQ